MTVTINGTTGISSTGGYAGDGISFADGTPANTLVTDTSGNVGVGTSSPVSQLHLVSAAESGMTIYKSAVGAGNVRVVSQGGGSALAFGSDQLTGTTERMRIDSSGNAGIGTSSPIRKLDVRNTSSDYQLHLGDSASTTLGYEIGRENTGGLFKFYGNQTGATGYIFSGVDGERMRIDTSGNLLVGTTSALSGSTFKALNGNGAATFRTDTSGAYSLVYFNNPNGYIGQIQTNGSATSYITSSDYRLKNTVAPMTNALAKVALLKPCTYKWNVDGSDGEGFIAHELAEVVPACVSGEKDAVDVEGNPRYQGIDASFLVATLTAAIQEQQAIITALTARVEALEGTQP